ncbi:MAG: hypothetical protein V1493_06530 [Candidatus Diapherotrites archaeon]
MQYELPMLMELFSDKAKAAGLTAQFAFDEREVAFLMHTKSETKKVQSVLAEAQELHDEALRKRFGKAVPAKQELEKEEAPVVEKKAEKIKLKKEKKQTEESAEHARQTTLFGKKK